MTKGLPDRKETLITWNVPAWEGDAMLMVLHDLGVNRMSRSPRAPLPRAVEKEPSVCIKVCVKDGTGGPASVTKV